MKAKGYIRLSDGSRIPYLGTANDFTMEEWNRMADRQAVKNYKLVFGEEPDSIEQAYARLKEKYEGHGQQVPKKDDIPVRRGNVEIIYYQ